MTPRRQVTIDMLPNNALLKTFDFFVDGNDTIDAWHTLAHVCRKWRNIVFEPPRRLNLHLHCTAGRSVRESLGIWPDSLIAIKLCNPPTGGPGLDNIAAPAHTDRVCEITIGMVAISLLEAISAAMQVPFPASIRLGFLPEPIAPDSFLGGSAPHPRPPAADLVRLTLHHIPHSFYISPEAMATFLATLTKLEFLGLDFESPRSYPDKESQRLNLPARSVLPALTQFEFRGVSEYLEDLVVRINAPLLAELYVIFFYQLILDTPHLAHFINRTPNIKPHNEAQVVFLGDTVQVLLGCMQKVILRTKCKPSDWQLSFVVGICNSFLSLVPAPEHLFICEGIHSRSRWQDDIENSQWVELLHLFTNVKNLYLSEGVVTRIAPALQELVEGKLTEVLPGLESLFLEGLQPPGLVDESHPSRPVGGSYNSVQEAIGIFVAARRLSKHPTNSRYWRGRQTEVIS